MAFTFKMQKVLEYREQLEEEGKVRLANAQAKLTQCRKQLQDLLQEINRAENKAAEEIMQAAEHWLHDQYLKGLREDQKMLTLQERMLAQMTEEARAYLAARAMDRKMLEKLKDKQRLQFDRQELKQEMNFNDEIATIRHKAPAVQAN